MTVREDSVLSNKYKSPVKYGGYEYPSAENALQASKFASPVQRSRMMSLQPFEAEYKGRRSNPTVKDWSRSRFDTMYGILKTKFSDPGMRSALIGTAGESISVENLNHEHDWGICVCSKCHGKGSNNLGKLLMQLREELIAEKEKEDAHEIDL